ncbi:MAG: FHIPEP family type III secretion protein, partial [Bacillota bacterium]
WVAAIDKEEAEINGFTVVDATTVMITHLTEFIKGHAHELLGRQEVKELLDMVKENNSAVVEELIPDQLSLGEIQKVLQNLLKERVPIRDLVTILEAIANGARSTRDTDFLTEVARQALQRTISRQQASTDGSLWVITLHPRLEQAIIDSLQVTQQGSYPALEPGLTQKIFERLSRLVEDMAREGHSPVVLCSSRARLPFRRLVERFLPNLIVLSLSELTPDLEVEAVGTVMLD